MRPFKAFFSAFLVVFLCFGCKKNGREHDLYRPHADIFISDGDEVGVPIYNRGRTSSVLEVDSLRKVSSLITAVSDIEIQAYKIPKGRRFKFIKGKIVKIYKGNKVLGSEVAFISYEELPSLKDSTVIIFLAPLKDFKLLRKYNIQWQQYPQSPIFANGEQIDSLLMNK